MKIPAIYPVRTRIFFTLCVFLFAAASYAHAGWMDGAKRFALEASEPVGIVIMIIGGMRVSTKDLYGGVAAFVGGIIIFKAQDIVSALK